MKLYVIAKLSRSAVDVHGSPMNVYLQFNNKTGSSCWVDNLTDASKFRRNAAETHTRVLPPDPDAIKYEIIDVTWVFPDDSTKKTTAEDDYDRAMSVL